MLIFERYTWWIGAMIGLALFLAVASQVGFLNPFQSVFLQVTAPVENGVSAVVRPAATFVTDATEIGSLREENRQLRLENEALRNELVGLAQVSAEVEELRSALGIIGESGEQEFEAASIVTRDASPFTDVIRIDKGSDHGIREGMVVLSTQGSLVGTVTEVFANRSSVRLISDSRSAVNAQITNTAIDGNVRGTATKSVKMELARGNISIGDEVVTSGVGGNYPRGLPIGTVVSAEGTAQDMYLDVTVEPRVRLSTLGNVLVNTAFDPTRQFLETQ